MNSASLAYPSRTDGHPRTDDRKWVRSLARIGLVSRGIVYLLLAYLALDISRHGSAPAQTSSTGALQELDTRPGGAAMLTVLAVGLACYGLWRLLSAITERRGMVRRAGSLVIALIYFALCAQAVEIVAGRQAGSGSSSNPQPWAGKVLGWDWGSHLLEVAGAVVIAGGLGLAIWGLVRHYGNDLALEQVGEGWRRVIKILGVAGDMARGFLVILVGTYLLEAGITANPTRAKGVDAALKVLVHHSYGAVLIGVVAAGLLCFGLFTFFEARLRRL